MFYSKHTRKVSQTALWFDKIMALIASINLVLVLFDLSYVPYRDLYVGRFCFHEWCVQFPEGFHQFYDRLKGIEPHRDTQKYLDTVDELKAQVARSGIDSPQVKPILVKLRRMSTETIEENPFERADKNGALESIKNNIRLHVFNDGEASAKQSFNRFWSQSHLMQKYWEEEIKFFDLKIRPCMDMNYFRHYGATGKLVDKFWQIDLYFNLLFFSDFLARTWFISRRNLGVKWMPEAMLWRWYDVFLFLPYCLPLPLFNPFFGVMRVIPVTFRLGQAKLVNLQPFWNQINRGVVANFAGTLTEIVVIRVINQVQDAIKNDLPKWIDTRNTRHYIDINDINEVEALSTRLVNLSVYKVWPEIQPDIEAILQHTVTSSLKNVPAYQGLQQIPGLGNLSNQLTEQLVSQVTQTLHDTLTSSLEDPVGAKLTSQLVEHFGQSLAAEIKKPNNIEDIQSLIFDFLEEVKINYVKRLEDEDFEQIVAQTEQLKIVKR